MLRARTTQADEGAAASLNELETTTGGFVPLSGRVVFSQVAGSRQCAAGGGGGRPAFVVLFRHCDEAFSPCSSAKYSGYQGCKGCEYLKDDACATNDCDGAGVQRAYGYGRWLACFAARTGAEIGGVFSQNPAGAATNARPMTTASMLYDSLLRLTDVPADSLCWAQFDRTAASAPSPSANPMVAALGSPAFNNKIVAIVWDHGNVQFVLRALGVSLGDWWWNGCCYDQAVVVSMKSRGMATYRLNTLGGSDACSGAVCQAALASFPGCPGPWPAAPNAPPAGPQLTARGTHVDLRPGSGLNDLATAGASAVFAPAGAPSFAAFAARRPSFNAGASFNGASLSF